MSEDAKASTGQPAPELPPEVTPTVSHRPGPHRNRGNSTMVAPVTALLAELPPRGRDLLYRSQRLLQAGLTQAGMRLFHRLLGRPSAPSRAERRAVAARLSDLLETDLAHVEAGHYPAHLLFRSGLGDTLAALPGGLIEFPRIIARARRQGFSDLPADVDASLYPKYYRRTFHWQTDGWLSDRSARLYDPGVDLLFGGTADVMRRMLIPPLRALPSAHPRILDVACGTGRFLEQVHAAMPRSGLVGLDLSAPYLERAKERLGHLSDLTLVRANAEDMPFEAGTFDAVTSIFLFHELPSDARRNVLRECLRVLAPGGLLAVLDSTQRDSGADIATALDNFPRLYHEPYFKGYLLDPLPDLLREVGFEVLSDREHFVSRAVIATKPRPHG